LFAVLLVVPIAEVILADTDGTVYAVGFAVVIAAAAWGVVWLIGTVQEALEKAQQMTGPDKPLVVDPE
jgi:hypothetical protein